MQSRFFHRVAVASALMFAFSACGDDSSGGPDFDGTATSDDTEEAGYDAANFSSNIIDGMNFGTPEIFLATSEFAARAEAKHPWTARTYLGARLSRGAIEVPGLAMAAGGGLQYSAAVGCTVESYGTDGDPFDPYDGNENGIPDDWGVKYTCTERDTSDAENVVTYTTRIEMSAKENTSALHGYSAKMLYEEKAADEEGNEDGVRYEAADALDIRAGSIDASGTYRSRGWSKFEGDLMEGIYGEERNASFDPDGAIALESPLPDGDLDFTGKQYYYETGDISLSFTIDTPTPLAYSAACYAADTNPPFTDGVIRGRLNGNSGSATFTVTFDDCNTFTVATENTDDPIPVSARPR